MVNCQVCHSSNQDDDVFCSHCGTRLVSEKNVLLDEIQKFKSTPEVIKIDQRVNTLRRMLEENPPSYQSYPALVLISALLMIFGALSMVGGLVGFGIVITSPTQEAYYQSLPSDGGPGPASKTTAPMSDNTRLFVMTVSASATVIGFLMVVMAQLLKLFIDLQENADRQSIALHGLFHLQMLNNERKANKDQ